MDDEFINNFNKSQSPTSPIIEKNDNYINKIINKFNGQIDKNIKFNNNNDNNNNNNNNNNNEQYFNNPLKGSPKKNNINKK